jgi:hypothetical protein
MSERLDAMDRLGGQGGLIGVRSSDRGVAPLGVRGSDDAGNGIAERPADPYRRKSCGALPTRSGDSLGTLGRGITEVSSHRLNSDTAAARMMFTGSRSEAHSSDHDHRWHSAIDFDPKPEFDAPVAVRASDPSPSDG